ncbi:helix-turn-helix domain-containing protein [Holophaga foetida]|uniref:helix-turn-helix domain-containing protein n=1 Tax=Holophaga foetida TaxID=35839 RepID=UPI0002472A45|nr:helix-turn-helix domain-containing protein [Holophaga foetida]
MKTLTTHMGTMVNMIPAPEAARLTSRSPQTLRRMSKAGDLPVFRVKRCLYYRLSDLEALFQVVEIEGGV